MKTRINNIFCKGDGFKVIILFVISSALWIFSASFFEVSQPDPKLIMIDVSNTNTTNLVAHLPAVRIGSGIR